MIHQNRKLLSFILTAAVFWGTLFACILPVRAQSAGQVKITSIDSTAFPTMNVQFEAYDAQGQFVQTLTAATLSLYENDLEQPVQSLELRNPGVQFTLAVNGGPELVRLYAGQPRFDAIFQNLGDWVMHQPAKTNDLFSLAASKKGITGAVLLSLCEARLDNTVYRLGIAPTRRAARQLVGHGHITVNKGVVNIASYSLRPGDEVAVRERSRSLEAITSSLSTHTNRFDWLDFNPATMTGKMIAMPERAQIPENIREQLIVELYSK